MIWLEILFTTIVAFVHSAEGQLSTNEVLKNVTQCDLRVDINLDCETGAVIVVLSLQYAYNVNCENTCCSYSNTDCFVLAEANDIKYLRRTCSGKKTCTISISKDKTDFTTCSLGVKHISYLFLQYYCIAETRIQSICSSGQQLSSANGPLYLTNEGYPGVTTGTMSCSCSVELFSCNSNINLYINDADLYSDTNNCEQNITFNDPDNKTLRTIGCEDHYGNIIEKVSLDSHYVKIHFTSSSIENLEGYFFVGFDSSVPDVSFQLTCTSQLETWCAGCGTVPAINNGNITLSKEDDDSFGATASLTCDSGYKTGTLTIKCQANGTWPTPECTEKPACSLNEWRCANGDCISKSLKCDNFPDCDDESDEQSCSAPICPEGLKACLHSNGSNVCVDDGINCDCGSVPSIDNGIVLLNGNSIIGAVADVTCNEGYNPSKPKVTCLKTGSWETVSCSLKAKPESSPTKKKDSGVNIIIIVVIGVVLLIFLGQLVTMCYLQCRIHYIRINVNEGDTEVHKRILMTILGSIPLVGLVPIYMTWKVFYRYVYKVSRKEKTDLNMNKPIGFSDSVNVPNNTVPKSAIHGHDCGGSANHNLGTDVNEIELAQNTKPEIHGHDDGVSANHNLGTDVNEIELAHNTSKDIPNIKSKSKFTVIPTKTAINASQITVPDGRHPGETMRRGISSVFSDNADDMTLRATPHPLTN